jgi:hypothetical protein
MLAAIKLLKFAALNGSDVYVTSLYVLGLSKATSLTGKWPLEIIGKYQQL